MPKTKTPAKLTVTKATSQARRHVDKLMPGVMATVESRSTFTADLSTPLVVTTITFPANHPNTRTLAAALSTLPGQIDTVQIESARLRVIREV